MKFLWAWLFLISGNPGFGQIPESIQIPGLEFQAQTYNNCGPAALAMVLSYWGKPTDQGTLKARLRTSDQDPSVSLEEIQTYTRTQGFQTRLVWAAEKSHIRNLLARGIPVLVKIWLSQTPSNQYAHTLLITGYDSQRIYTQDPLRGPGFAIGWEKFLGQWEIFGRSLLAVVPSNSALETRLSEVFPSDPRNQDRAAAWLAQIEKESPSSGYHKVVLGFTQEAVRHFLSGLAAHQAGDLPRASREFTQGFTLGLPIRILWYFPQPLEAWFQTQAWASLQGFGQKALNFYPHLDEVKAWMAQGKKAQKKP